MSEASGGAGAAWDARGWRGALLVVATALVAQSWILELPFQLDDYRLLADPLAHFAHARDFQAESDLPAFMLRWPLWLLWGAVRLVSSEPLAPLPFHAVGLALHAVVALLLARAVERWAAPRGLAGAGLVAGIAFGLAAGHVQAVSWTSAWSSLLYTLFGLAAFEVLAAGPPGRRGAHLAAGAFLVYLALVCKASAVVLLPLLALLLVGAPRRARPAAPLLVLGAAALAYSLTRWLWFGSLEFRYYARGAPEGNALLGAFPSGLVALGQALYPWCRAPELVAADPLLARLFARPLGLGAPALAALLVLPGPVLAAARHPSLRRALLLFVPALLLAVYPAGVLYDGQTTNVASRAVYLPMALTCAVLGLTLRTLWSAPSLRRAGSLWAVALATLLADGLGHVVAVERTAADEQRYARSLVDSIVAEQRDSGRAAERLCVVALRPPSGLADVPVLGDLLPRAFRPPFVPAPGVDVRVVDDSSILLRRLPDERLEHRDLAVIGPELDAAGRPRPPALEAPGETNARRRALRRHGPLQAGSPDGIPLSAITLRPSGTGEWTLSEPLAPHALAALAVEPPGVPWRGRLVVVRTDGSRHSLALEIDGDAEGGRLALDPRAELAHVLGAPVARLSWEGPAPRSLSVLDELPALQVLAPAEGESIDLTAGAPRFSAALPSGWRPGATAELELRVTDIDRVVLALASAAYDTTRPLDILPDVVHVDGTSLPWEAFAAEARRRLVERGQEQATVRWRLTLRHPGGHAAMRGPLRSGRLTPGPR